MTQRQHQSQHPSSTTQPQQTTRKSDRHEHPLQRLQHMFGNQAVQRMVQAHTAVAALQTKLVINQPGDIYEQEADRVAEQVMRMPEPQLQRACACGGTCSTYQEKRLDQEHEHEHIQMKCIDTNRMQQREVPPIVNEVLASPGQPLDPLARSFMEPRFDYDFSRIRVHTDAKAAESATAVNALAYTVGEHVIFGPGHYAPFGETGRQLLAHELAHVRQQTPGQRTRLQPLPVSAVVAKPQRSSKAVIERVGQQQTDSTQTNGHHGVLQRKVPEGTKNEADIEEEYGPPNRGYGVVTIEQFIRDIETVERANPMKSAQEILTLIRKLYYGRPAGDLNKFEQLLPDSPDVPAVETCVDDEGRACSGPIGVCVCAYVTGEQMPSPKLIRAIRRLRLHADENASGDNPSPYVLVGEELVDIGHVLLGVDALLHPTSNYLPFRKYGLSATSPAGWQADVGIAMVLLKEHQNNKKKSAEVISEPSPTVEDYYQYSAPSTDILGDVDAFGIPFVQSNSLSGALRAYYLTNEGMVPMYQQNRWAGFATVNGFQYSINAGKVTWEKATRDLVIQQIIAFADLYALREAPFTVLLYSTQHQQWPDAGKFADRFLENVRGELEKELTHNAKKKP